MKPRYQPRSGWDRPQAPQRRAVQSLPQQIDQTKAPREGDAIEIDGRQGIVAIFDGGMRLVDVVWSDGTGALWHVTDWKRLWGEK